MIDIFLFGNCIEAYVYHEHAEIDRVRFINIVTQDINPPPAHKGIQVAPYIDPPINGWKYEPYIKEDDIYYWDSNGDSKFNIKNHNLPYLSKFVDCPADPYLTPEITLDFKTLIVDTYNNNEVIYTIDWQLTHLRKVKLLFHGESKVDSNIKKLFRN